MMSRPCIYRTFHLHFLHLVSSSHEARYNAYFASDAKSAGKCSWNEARFMAYVRHWTLSRIERFFSSNRWGRETINSRWWLSPTRNKNSHGTRLILRYISIVPLRTTSSTAADLCARRPYWSRILPEDNCADRVVWIRHRIDILNDVIRFLMESR